MTGGRAGVSRFARSVLAGLSLWLFAQPALATQQDTLARGQRIFILANCFSCHTDSENDGQPLAGGRELKTPFGVFVTPNITPDPSSGIGDWTEQQFLLALGEGLSPTGEHYFPSFPYTAYQSMTRRDMRDLYAYLMSRQPVVQDNPPHRLQWFVSRYLLGGWKAVNRWLNPRLTAEQQADRGYYLRAALGHCQECHTPRNMLGMLDRERDLQGNEMLEAPDLTPRNQQGIADWSDDELEEFLRDGLYPDGDYVGGHMADVVEHSTQHWSEQDMAALIASLRAIP